MRHIGLIVALACLGFFAVASTAHAQMPGTGLRGQIPPVKQRGTQGEKSPEPPPALPGASNTMPPAEKTAGDLPPTEALFDAINRGDITSARDALSRGADLNGHNVLGMTPMELSVDLSRNDITFLLLSLRAPDALPLDSAKAVAAKTPAPKSPGAKQAAKPAVVAVAKPPKPAAPPPVLPRQYAGPGDSGTPNPQAGFLGFGGTVQ